MNATVFNEIVIGSNNDGVYIKYYLNGNFVFEKKYKTMLCGEEINIFNIMGYKCDKQ